jgi:hypothetical protein
MSSNVTVESPIAEADGNGLEALERGPARAKPQVRTSWLKTTRLLHRYMGLFFAPAILFFAFSGAIQTFDLHKANARTGYAPPMWVLEMAQIHKSQNMNVAKGKSKPKKAESDATDSVPDDAPAPKIAATPRHSALAMKWFVLIMSAGLILSTLLGIYMSFQYGGDPRLAWGALLTGTLIPVALLVI